MKRFSNVDRTLSGVSYYIGINEQAWKQRSVQSREERNCPWRRESHPTIDACLPKFCEFHEIQFRELGIFNDGSLKHSEMGPLSCIVGSQG